MEFDQKFCQTFVQFHVIWGFGNELPNFSKTTKEGEKICPYLQMFWPFKFGGAMGIICQVNDYKRNGNEELMMERLTSKDRIYHEYIL